jgi:DNA relaxase NicK
LFWSSVNQLSTAPTGSTVSLLAGVQGRGEIIEEASRQFEKIFGFGITEQCTNGENFYRDS